MPIHGYPGNVITANPTAPTSSVASGVWTTEQQLVAVAAGNWPFTIPTQQISRSLRFNPSDTAYLNRTLGSSNRRTFTFSTWVKRSLLASNQCIFGNINFAGGGSTNQQFFLGFNGSDQLDLLHYNNGTSNGLTSSAVYRDPSAFYHVVCAIDTTQATSSNRLKLYINGSQITAFASSSYPTQNTDTFINANLATAIGTQVGTGIGNSYYIGGYLTEINFIDGQALTPSSFGRNNIDTGVWEPLAYTGTYGTNGFYLPFSDNSSVNALGLDQSGNTSGSSDTAPVTLGVNGTGWTGYGIRQVIPASGLIWSGNKCRVKLTGGSSGLTVVGCAIGKQAASGNAWDFDGNQASVTFSGSSSVTISANTTVYSDWISFSISTANTYVVGMAVSNSGTNTVQRGTNTNFVAYDKIGGYTDATSTAPSGYSTAGSNTILFAGLELQANNWTPNNFSVTAGAGNDSLVDSPTSYGTDTGVGGTVRGNYCTLNPNDNGNSNILLTNGNLSVSSSTTWDRGVKGTFGVASGKWYYEYTHGTVNAGTNPAADIGWTKYPSLVNSASNGGSSSSDSYFCQGSNGNKYNAGSGSSYGSAFTTGDVEMCAIDLDNGKVYWGKNGTWFNSGDPAAGTNAAYTGLSGTFFPLWYWGISAGTSGVLISNINFGQRAFAYTAPSGFKALCTQNLPTPTIGATSTTQAGKYMNVVLYTATPGTGATVSGVGFQPDLLWTKNRDNAESHYWQDAVRGFSPSSNVTRMLSSNLTSAEYSLSDITCTPTSDGFTVVDSSPGSGEFWFTNRTYVGWCWNAGGSNATNTAGTITSTVRANTTSGFSIVTYTGTGSNATVGHGLGVAPSMVIVKRRSGADGWPVFTTMTSNAYIFLNSTGAAATGGAATLFGNGSTTVSPTSTVFSIATDSSLNASGSTYVAYCFAAVAGYSAFGSYTGNGSTDGPFVYLGFRPEFVMIKGSSVITNWTIVDAARNTSNVTTLNLRPNSSAAETTDIDFDLLSNGFKMRGSGSGGNNSGSTYIYMAFAESPFKYALAR